MKSASQRGYLRILGVIGVVLFGSGELCAQVRFGPQPIQPFNPQLNRPTVSPYLNLLRPGGSAAFNYYTLVRPQLDFQQSINTIQTQVLQNRQTLTDLAQQSSNSGGASDLPPTSNVPAFLNTGGYFSGGSTLRSGGMRTSGGTFGSSGVGRTGPSNGGIGSRSGGGNITLPRPR
jgi:hypothetical protein